MQCYTAWSVDFIPRVVKKNKEKLHLAQFASNLLVNVLKTPSFTLGLILNHITCIEVWLLVGLWTTLPQEKSESSCACLITLHRYRALTVSRWTAAQVLGLGVVLLTVTAAVVAVMIAVGEDSSRTCSQYTATIRKSTTLFSWSWQLKTDFFWKNTHLSGEQPGGTGILGKGTFLRLRLIWYHLNF